MPDILNTEGLTETTQEQDNNVKAEEPQKVPKKRGRKPGTKRKGYFYEEQEEAFKKYITSTDQIERNKLFNNILYPAFTKMVESLIRRYNLFTPDEEFEDTFNDTMSFLLTKVNNFDVSKGYKVYSYCGTVCKNYLIYKRTQSIKQRDRFLCYDNVSNDSNTDKADTNDNLIHKLNTDIISNMSQEIKKTLSSNIHQHNLTENQEKIGYALLELLDNWDKLFKQMGSTKFNRATVSYFIKEYTMLSTKEVRDGSKIYKKMYKELKEKLLKE